MTYTFLVMVAAGTANLVTPAFAGVTISAG
jgi:hypothetical protein